MTTSPTSPPATGGAPAPARGCACNHTHKDTIRAADDGPSRRHVLAGLGAIGAAVTLAACSSPQTAAPTAPAPDADDLPPGAIAKVADVPVGGAIAVQLEGAPVIVAQPEQGTFVGLSAICTHQGCTVAPDGAGLTCPCHGSTFTLGGEVGQGPATENLATFDVSVEGDHLVAAL